MVEWSAWALDANRSDQDQQNWYLYRAEISDKRYTGQYDQRQYSRLLYPEYVASPQSSCLVLERVDAFDKCHQHLSLGRDTPLPMVDRR